MESLLKSAITASVVVMSDETLHTKQIKHSKIDAYDYKSDTDKLQQQHPSFKTQQACSFESHALNMKNRMHTRKRAFGVPGGINKNCSDNLY